MQMLHRSNYKLLYHGKIVQIYYAEVRKEY